MEAEPETPKKLSQKLLALIGLVSRDATEETIEPNPSSLALEEPLKEAFGEDAVRKEDGEIIVDF